MKNKKIIIIVLIVVISSAIFVPTSISKFKEKEEIKNQIEIAEPIFIVEGNEKTKISAINNIGYYEFSIKNFKDTKVSETGFRYIIEIVSKTDEAIEFELYKGDEQIKLGELKTEELSIEGNEKIEQKYKLKVIYDKTKGTQGKDILEEVQVKIHSEQMEVG